MSNHWSTQHLSEDEVRLNYERIMSRAAGRDIDEVADELQMRLSEAHAHGSLREDAAGLEWTFSQPKCQKRGCHGPCDNPVHEASTTAGRRPV